MHVVRSRYRVHESFNLLALAHSPENSRVPGHSLWHWHQCQKASLCRPQHRWSNPACNWVTVQNPVAWKQEAGDVKHIENCCNYQRPLRLKNSNDRWRKPGEESVECVHYGQRDVTIAMKTWILSFHTFKYNFLCKMTIHKVLWKYWFSMQKNNRATWMFVHVLDAVAINMKHHPNSNTWTKSLSSKNSFPLPLPFLTPAMVASVDLMSIMWQRMRSKIFAAWNPISIFSSVYLAKSEDRGFSRRTEWTAFQTTWNDKKPVNLVIPGLLLMKDDSDSLLLTRAPKEMGMEQCDHNDSCSLSYEFLDSFLLPFSTILTAIPEQNPCPAKTASLCHCLS